MKLRYVTRGPYYIPQFQKDGEQLWNDFKVKHITGQLLVLVESLGNIQRPQKWGQGQWHFEPAKGQETREMPAFFDKEMFCMAFLGAAKSFYTEKSVEFEI